MARRVWGANRFATAAAISRLMWPYADDPFADIVNLIDQTATEHNTPAGAVVCNGYSFADAIPAAAWAGIVIQDAMPVLFCTVACRTPAEEDERFRAVGNGLISP